MAFVCINLAAPSSIGQDAPRPQRVEIPAGTVSLAS
jgi:hypothetical protein